MDSLMSDTTNSHQTADRSDIRLLFATRCVRLFAYGFLSVVLVLYLQSLGFSAENIGLLLTLTMIGDTAISLGMTSWADRIGRRRMLKVGAILMLLAGILFGMTRNFFWLLFAATVGVISPSGNEVGPFLSIEQAALSQLVPGVKRTMVFAWYNLVGSFSTATGALVGGWTCELARRSGSAGSEIYRPVIWGYATFGAILAVMFLGLTPSTEAPRTDCTNSQKRRGLGLGKSRGMILKLSALFSLDAFGGGFIVQSVLAYWFYQRFQIHEERLGEIFFGANLLAGFSALAAAWMAKRFGLINTMVFTHLPSNLLLLIVPLMPNYYLAVAVLWIRFSISQMDVPTRQSYVMAVVAPDERAAAAGVTAIARSLGAAISPWIAVTLIANSKWADVVFYACGGVKILYDLLLYREFVTLKPQEEQ